MQTMRVPKNKGRRGRPPDESPAASLWRRVDVPSAFAPARQVEDRILAHCRRLAYTDRDLFALKLAIEEALTNAVRHGNQLDPHKSIHIKYRITPHRADVVVEDEGGGFNPAALPDPTRNCRLSCAGGRGILLMRAFMNSVVYNAAGNGVTLTKFNNAYPRHAGLLKASSPEKRCYQ